MHRYFGLFWACHICWYLFWQEATKQKILHLLRTCFNYYYFNIHCFGLLQLHSSKSCRKTQSRALQIDHHLKYTKPNPTELRTTQQNVNLPYSKTPSRNFQSPTIAQRGTWNASGNFILSEIRPRKRADDAEMRVFRWATPRSKNERRGAVSLFVFRFAICTATPFDDDLKNCGNGKSFWRLVWQILMNWLINNFVSKLLVLIVYLNENEAKYFAEWMNELFGVICGYLHVFTTVYLKMRIPQ